MTDLEKLADLVAERIRPAIPVDVDLWSAKEVGAYLKVSARQALERYAPLPDFPKPVRLPSTDPRAAAQPGKSKTKGKGHPRWQAKEVIAWALKHKVGEGSGPGRSAGMLTWDAGTRVHTGRLAGVAVCWISEHWTGFWLDVAGGDIPAKYRSLESAQAGAEKQINALREARTVDIFDAMDKHPDRERSCPKCTGDDVKFALHNQARTGYSTSAACNTCGHSEAGNEPEALYLAWTKAKA